MIFPFVIFRIILALTAWVTIIYDNYNHRDLKLVAYAYTFLVIGTILSYFVEIYKEVPVLQSWLELGTHSFAVLISGFLFFLTAFAAHQKMIDIKRKTKIAFKGLK